MPSVRIILFCILAAIGYGIVHDQITARISVEYFTVGHPRIIASESPTALGLVWGVVATWWAGLILGVALVIAARAGNRPKLGLTGLRPSIFRLIVCMAVIAFVAGCIGYFTSKGGIFYLVEPFASAIPPERHTGFLTAGWSHVASYLVAFVGGLVVCIRTWIKRGKLEIASPAPVE